MNRYSIYCTEAQTKKALELGAPIEYAQIKDVPNTLEVNGILYRYPTTDQMIGWLEEQGLAIDIIRDNTCYRSSVWRNDSPDDGWDFYKENEVEKFSRGEVTLAAIDVALEYLSSNNK